MTASDDLRAQVLEACHGLAAYGLGPGIGGHVSVRVPGKEQYWTNVLDRTFEEMTLEDIVLLDFDGNVVEAGRPVSPGIGFHPGIYRLRPEAGAVVHTHGYWVTAQSAFARPPRTFHNLATYFHDRVAVAPDDEIESIAPALRENDIAIVIPWHGAITIGKDLGEAAALHVTFDYACRLDVMLAGTDAPPMPDEHGRAIQKLLAKANYLELTWDLIRRKAKRAHNGEVVVPLAA
jgi:ribulose-5-phosphate 4-epimerase/fuculose-1-phosphate aldolase